MNKNFDKLMAKTSSLTMAQLKKEGEDLFEIKMNRENSLLDAFAHKQLKSKALINEVKAIKAARAKAKKARKEKESGDKE